MYRNVVTEMSPDRNGQSEMSRDRNSSDRNGQIEKSRTPNSFWAPLRSLWQYACEKWVGGKWAKLTWAPHIVVSRPVWKLHMTVTSRNWRHGLWILEVVNYRRIVSRGAIPSLKVRSRLYIQVSLICAFYLKVLYRSKWHGWHFCAKMNSLNFVLCKLLAASFRLQPDKQLESLYQSSLIENASGSFMFRLRETSRHFVNWWPLIY